MGFLDKILRFGEGRRAKKIWKVADQVNELEPEIRGLTDAQLAARTDEFRARHLEEGESLDDLLVEVFATVREACRRTVGERPYDVQVFGGIALHRGFIAEMKTGEGKTLTSTMPVFLNALTGEGVHVVTVNEYLAKRDARWMGQVHQFLGLDVGAVYSQQSKEDKKAAYAADITYGTTNEFGFDYLRDHMVMSVDEQVQRGHHFALLDEVDSILIDEARTPLIISGPAEQSAQWYQVFARQVAPNLTRGQEGDEPGQATGDYTVDEAKRTVSITEEGVAKVEQILGMDDLYESVNTPLIQHLQNALKAKELFKRDREYIVDQGRVKIVDEQTGRVLEGRRYSEGLHQAIEAKEGVDIQDENQTLATITLQNYFRSYDKLAGMTGTAKTEEAEFVEIYDLPVVVVPTNEPLIRERHPDVIYKTEDAKFEAVADDIEQRHERGQPVLVGTTDVAKSERVSALLGKRGVPHEVLNAKNHAREANIVAQAGRLGAVTVSTNMAGRGTDIIPGGNPEELAEDEVSKLPDDADADERERVHREALEEYEEICAKEREQVLERGGLYVVGTERHQARRIDNQLRGRTGRQGDPGESRFYLSLEDDLMRLFNASAVDRIMTRLNIPDDVPIEANMVSKAVERAQSQVESRNFDIRKNVLKYDDVLNEQRKVIYSQRQRLLEGDHDDVDELAQKYIEDVVEGAVDQYAPEGVFPEEWDLAGLEEHLGQIWELGVDPGEELDDETADRDDLLALLMDDMQRAYEVREQQVGGHEIMREVERRVILSVVDRKWRQHLYEMDALRDGIGLRSVGQRDPLTEYQREAYDSFVAMMQAVKDEAVMYFFHLPVRAGGEAAEDRDARETEETAEERDAVAVAAGAVTSSDGARGADGNGQPGELPDNLRFEEQDQQRQLSYSSAESGSQSLGVSGDGGDGGAGGGSGDSSGVTKREDGTTVRQIASGGTYTKEEDEFADVGRNDPCPCGSGSKFKKCHGR